MKKLIVAICIVLASIWMANTVMAESATSDETITKCLEAAKLLADKGIDPAIKAKDGWITCGQNLGEDKPVAKCTYIYRIPGTQYLVGAGGLEVKLRQLFFLCFSGLSERRWVLRCEGAWEFHAPSIFCTLLRSMPLKCANCRSAQERPQGPAGIYR